MKKTVKKQSITGNLSGSLPAINGELTGSIFFYNEVKKDTRQLNILRLAWELLRRDGEYEKDYKWCEQNPTERKRAELCLKWGLGSPLDPSIDFTPAHEHIIALKYFLEDWPVFVLINDGPSGMIQMEINLQYSKTRIIKEIKKIIDKGKSVYNSRQSKDKRVNLLNVKGLKKDLAADFQHYEDILLVHNLKVQEVTSKGKKRTWAQLCEEMVKRGRADIAEKNKLRNLHMAYSMLRKRLLVPRKDIACGSAILRYRVKQ